MTALRNMLLVTYQFPPIGGSGVQRAVKLARYLPESGWRARVLSAGHTHYPLLDPVLTHELGPDVSVHRTCGMEPAAVASTICRHLGREPALAGHSSALEDRIFWRLQGMFGRLPLPETEMLWIPSAIRRARALVQRHGIEAVVTTSPPHSTHLVGLTLKRRLGLPWVADLRDPILDNFAYDPTTRLADRFWRWIERTVLHSADHVVVTCPELAERFLSRYPELNAEHISTITNGFDPADRPAARTVPTGPRTGRFVLSYVGAFYRDQTIEPMLLAIRSLRARRSDIAAELSFRLVGSLSRSQRRFLQAGDAVFFDDLGYRTHGEAIEEMARADVLLLATPASDGGRLCIPAKTFEYLAFGRHVIALVHEDTEMAKILADAGNVTLVSQAKPVELERAIERCYDAWRAGGLCEPRNHRVLERFRRDRLAAEFAKVLDRSTGATAARTAPREEPMTEEAVA